MAELIINGNPFAIFEFETLDSWNEAIEMANKRPRWARSYAHARAPFNAYIQKWRQVGYEMAEEFLQSVVVNPYAVDRAMVVVKVFRPTQHLYDVHNVYMKAIFDGFSDAKLWRDDNYRHVPWVLYGFVEQDELEMLFMGKQFIVEVYHLDRVIMRGHDITPRIWRDEDYGKRPRRNRTA